MTVKINNTFIGRIAQAKPEKVRKFGDAALRGFVA